MKAKTRSRGARPLFDRIYEDGNLREEKLPDGDMQAFYKGKKVDYDKDYLEILEERAHRISQGKDPAPITNRN